MFTEIRDPSTFGSYNVHNVLAGSNHIDLGLLCQAGSFPKPNTQISKYLGGEGYTAVPKANFQILSLVQCLCALKACYFSLFIRY